MTSTKRSTKALRTQRSARSKPLEEKWGREAVKAGFTAIPNAMLEHQHQLGLDATDLAIVVHLVRFWWHKEDLPYPGKARLATALGIDKRTVPRRIARMEKAGLLEREARFAASGGQRTNYYRVAGLVGRVEEYARHMLEEREEQKQKRANRRRRGLRPAVGDLDEESPS